MKAAISTGYGLDDLEIIELEKPIPKKNEVLIRVHASTVTTGDWRVKTMSIPSGFGLIAKLIFGFSKPRKPIVLGTELSGVIESIGSEIKKFKTGDPVLAITGAKFGAYAEYICLPETATIALKPENLSFEEAVSLPFGGVTALVFLRERGKILPGEKVLVYGASGSVGIAAVQLAKHLGGEVTGVCSTANLNLVKKMGAANVIDYTKEDFKKNGQLYDLIVDTVGSLDLSNCQQSLTVKGRLLLVSASLWQLLKTAWVNQFNAKKIVTGGPVMITQDLMDGLLGLVSLGKLMPMIDRVYPLGQIREAFSYVSKRHKKGNVVVKLQN